MATTYTVVPHYGRNPKTADEVREQFRTAKDFKVQDVSCPWNGSAVGIEEARNMGLILHARYNNLTEVVMLDPNDFPAE